MKQLENEFINGVPHMNSSQGPVIPSEQPGVLPDESWAHVPIS